MVLAQPAHHRFLVGVVRGAEGDVVDRPGALPATARIGGNAQVDDAADTRRTPWRTPWRTGPEAHHVAVLADPGEAEHVGQDGAGGRRVGQIQADAVEAADGVLGPDAGDRPGRLGLDARNADDGQALKLPAFLEAHRAELERVLPALS